MANDRIQADPAGGAGVVSGLRNMPASVVVAVWNRSTVVGDGEAQLVAATVQRQVSEDFGPVWGIDATLVFCRADDAPPRGSWWLVILDDTDQAGILGYHDETDEGMPLGKVFAKTD